MPSLGLETICLAIWAREGVFQNSFDTTALGEIAPDAVDDWLLFPRTSYDSTGWDELLPNYKSIVLDGNHFTIMKQPLVSILLCS
jgi:thioesterase domain-containing protein